MMLLYIDKNGITCKVFKSYHEVDEQADTLSGGHVVCTREIKGFAIVAKHCYYLTAITGKSYIPVDHGEHVSPRYDIMELPSIGDKVSYGFNGDYYPDGEIVKISKTLQITTSNGHVYRRRKNSATWARTGGTWCLVSGHRSELNPSF